MMISTTIGSLPNKNVDDAMGLLMKYPMAFPAWPQLPKSDFKEDMVVQYSENFPGIVLDEAERKISVDLEKAWAEIEVFYQNYLDNNLPFFSISENHAKGFYAFANDIKAGRIPANTLKCQTVGPITFGMMLKDISGHSVFADDQLRDVIIKHISMKSVWQIRELSNIQPPIQAFGGRHPTPDTSIRGQASNIIVFLDEPYLAAYGSAFTALNRDEAAKTIADTLTEIKSLTSKLLPATKLEIGIHCCGNTDWSLLLGSDMDIVSFDAYGYFDNLLLYSDLLRSFFARKGKLAWGIVPTNSENVAKETAGNLAKLLNNQFNALKSKIPNSDLSSSQIIITPSCGMGSLSEEHAGKVLALTKEISDTLSL